MNYNYSFNDQWAKNVAQFENGKFCNYTLKDGNEICYFHYIKRDIANELSFLKKGKWFDIVTPFDYGGIYYTNEALLGKFLKGFEEHCQKENIISGFFRFNPLLKQNYTILEQYIDITKVQEHVFIQLNTEYKKEFSKRKLRNIQKASKYNYALIENDTIENFYKIYLESMHRVHSSEYFLFDKDVLQRLLQFSKIFSIRFEDSTVSSIFIIEDDETIYYFLGGTASAYLDYGFNSLLFDLVCSYYSSTKKRFFLGGGKNGLYQYKKEFSNQTVPFYIGKKIFNKDMYNELISISQRDDNDFFPKYRKKVI